MLPIFQRFPYIRVEINAAWTSFEAICWNKSCVCGLFQLGSRMLFVFQLEILGMLEYEQHAHILGGRILGIETGGIIANVKCLFTTRSYWLLRL